MIDEQTTVITEDADPSAGSGRRCLANELEIIVAGLQFRKRIWCCDIAEKIAVFVKKPAVIIVAFKILPRQQFDWKDDLLSID